MFLQQFERKFIVALRQSAVAHHVGKHDGREFALLAVFGRHERIKPDRARNEMVNTPTPSAFANRHSVARLFWAARFHQSA